MNAADPNLVCSLCGQEHREVRLAPGESASCGRCGAMLERRGLFGPDATMAYAVTGLIFSVPAAVLPFMTAEKLGDERVGFLFTGMVYLWGHGMALLAIPVLLFGFLLPVCLLGTFGALMAGARLGLRPTHAQGVHRAARVAVHWAMPEVQVLAVLVALMKLGSVVDVTIGPGFWCYAAMSVFLLLAWRTFDLSPA
jgi:paraquat-inducible protein A